MQQKYRNTKELVQCPFMNPSEIPKILQSLKINPDEISDKRLQKQFVSFFKS
jgi:hypothetical protein